MYVLDVGLFDGWTINAASVMLVRWSAPPSGGALLRHVIPGLSIGLTHPQSSSKHCRCHHGRDGLQDEGLGDKQGDPRLLEELGGGGKGDGGEEHATAEQGGVGGREDHRV